MPPNAREITALLKEWRRGDHASGEELIAIVYPELRRMAALYLRRKAPNHTLQPTALVHELYVRLLAANPVEWQDRIHFFAVAAQQMRRILIDYLRAAWASKRGGGQLRVTLTELAQQIGPRSDDLLALDEALTRLAERDPRAARVVELRFFGGLHERDAALALNISVATLKRDWKFARAWLSAELSQSKSNREGA
jgi:RNA polymerase sigma factor (TIGR02999 family)